MYTRSSCRTRTAEPETPTVETITAALLSHVPADVLDDLRTEDPVAAIEVHFPPIKVMALPRSGVVGECSTDGFYDPEITPGMPRIFYADDVAESRVRFTVLHELGHHLFVNDAATLLDDLDQRHLPAV